MEQQAIDDKVSAHDSAVVPLDEDELPDIVAFRVEFARAVFSMKNGKAVGEDGLPIDFAKAASDNFLSLAAQVARRALQWCVPAGWRTGRMVMIPKKPQAPVSFSNG